VGGGGVVVVVGDDKMRRWSLDWKTKSQTFQSVGWKQGQIVIGVNGTK
jgi:type II secretory pathway component PulC